MVTRVSDSVRATCKAIGLAVLFVGFVAPAGCKRNDPQPSHFADLSTDADPVLLLPTGGPLNNPAVAKGSAEWVEFRTPGEAAPAVAAGGGGNAGAAVAPGGEPAIAGEIRSLVDDYNGLITDGSYGEASEFFVADQAPVIEKLGTLLPSVAEKLKALNDALPEPNALISESLTQFKAGSALKIMIKSVSADGDQAATAVVEDGGTVFVTSPGSETPGSVAFAYDDGEGYWFISADPLAGLAPMLPAIEQNLGQLDQLIAGLGDGSISADALGAQLDATTKMFLPLIGARPAGAGGSPSGGGDADGPDVDGDN